MTDSLFDNDLRRALLDSASADFAFALADADADDIHFSAGYLRKMNQMCRNPIGYARRLSRPVGYRVLRIAASIVLAISVLFGALMLIPDVRAAFVRVFIKQHDTHTEFEFTGSGTVVGEDANWYPAYIPEGFEEITYEKSLDEITVRFSNGTTKLSFKSIPVVPGSGFNIDNEHSTEVSITINGTPATLYQTTDPDYSSFIIWMSADENTAFRISGRLSVDELIKIAESVTNTDS